MGTAGGWRVDGILGMWHLPSRDYVLAVPAACVALVVMTIRCVVLMIDASLGLERVEIGVAAVVPRSPSQFEQFEPEIYSFPVVSYKEVGM